MNEEKENSTQVEDQQEEQVVEQVETIEEKSSSDESVDDEERILSDEEIDSIADIAIGVIKDILRYFHVGEITIDEYEGEEGELILDITGDDMAILIGRHGKTLDALQLIVSSVTLRNLGFRYPVIVDVEGYKARQKEKIEDIAYSSADKAVRQNKSVKLRPMTPYERRIVHIALRDDDRVQTASEGEGSSRHVVVIPV